uniref:DUF4283 domain-containing protein n=1 Tax=Ananas comosus var. bracteatus TaxID=296719 RepID=A0A6V7PPS9_ANACO|nr:unnamed protein product [Ananas comosus var. bracteatus]
MLVRREVLTLEGFWIRCWPWGRYRDARPHRVQYKAWIRLINLPFEIWSVARVATLISGFGRFIKADAVTKAMTDLRAFRCQIALDSINSIPQNLSVIVGEELFPVMIHLERWERSEEGGAAAPPAPPRNGHGIAEERAGNRNQGHQGDRGEDPADEDMEDAEGEIEEAEPTPPVHRALRVMQAVGPLRQLPQVRVPTAAFSTAIVVLGSAARQRAAVGPRHWVATARGPRSS